MIQVGVNRDFTHSLAEASCPQVPLVKQVKGVGTLIVLIFLLTLEDPHRLRKSRSVGYYIGLQLGRRNSGNSRLEKKRCLEICQGLRGKASNQSRSSPASPNRSLLLLASSELLKETHVGS